jgi:lipid-binding SYLF domain-containing protein
LNAMIQKDPDLAPTLERAAGYAVFPKIGKGGFVVGAAYGRGILYDHGHQAGYVELNQGSVGAQIGAQSFAELIVFLRDEDVQSLKNGEFSVGGNVSAVALTNGAAAGADLTQGVAVFVLPHGGLMAELSVSGQKINFEPLHG